MPKNHPENHSENHSENGPPDLAENSAVRRLCGSGLLDAA
jgi:hypothetical protein